jgi:predicted small lipoprotein YifL
MAAKMKRVIFCVLWCCGWISLSGCGEKYPADFPKVYPMTVTVTDGTTPLSNIRIMFYQASRDSGAAYASSGSTDAGGVAVISTTQGSFNKKGIPEGEFVVTLEDIITPDIGVTPEEQNKMTMKELNKVSMEYNKKIAEYKRKVPAVLCKSGKVADRSPIRYTASSGKNELTVDVSEYKK